MNTARKGKDISGRIADLDIAKHLDVGSSPVEIQAVTPPFLVSRHKMNIILEKKCLAGAVIPSP